MNTSQQNRIFTQLPKEDAHRLFEALDAALEEDGHAVSVFETFEDSGVFEVSVYVDAEETDAVIAQIAKTAKAANLETKIVTEELQDEDWVAKSLEGLKPVRVDRFVVHGSHDRDMIGGTETGIEIEAGQAFGTGHHGTTAGCLDMMARLFRRRVPNIVLDVGTGSAVLAIAAAKRWKVPVIATDIDPVATKVARHNAALNGVGGLVHCLTTGGLTHNVVRGNGPYPVIVANILAKPLMKLAPQFAENLTNGGDVILSGILAQQRFKVLAAFRQQGLYHQKTIWREGWVTLHLRANSPN
ncbi:MAG: 50S ribosomal protein L11 methyltransferase [Pseudomonadota bacterium]